VKTFAPTDVVYLSFLGDFGKTSWVEGDWTVSGKLDPEGTRSITLKDDQKQVDGSFSYLPKGGWPKGTHSVTMIINDEVAGKYTFTVA
jgi:hypothetical protein